MKDFAAKMYTWMKEGFKELGDRIGLGIGKTTSLVLRHSDFLSDPHKVCNHFIPRKRENSEGRVLDKGGNFCYFLDEAIAAEERIRKYF